MWLEYKAKDPIDSQLINMDMVRAIEPHLLDSGKCVIVRFADPALSRAHLPVSMDTMSNLLASGRDYIIVEEKD